MKKKVALLLSLVLAVIGIMPSLITKAEEIETVAMFRLYNPNSGEHFYTQNEVEMDSLIKIGWSDEGIGWIAPEISDTPVYRFYNPNTGDHHYTTAINERDNLLLAGWIDEGIGWYSDDSKTVPVYREFNPNAVTGTHNYTADKNEHDNLASLGWNDEGIGWYAISSGKSEPTEPEDPEDPEDPKNPKEPKDLNDETLQIGDTVLLGTYEQDNDLTNGSEPIEWQYVDNRDGHKMLLSKYALDLGYYNEDDVQNVTWEDCSLRKWLNEDFYDTAFSASDKEIVLLAHNENADSYELFEPWAGGSEGGNDTNDKVFLLSWTEARDCLDGKLFKKSDSQHGCPNPKAFCNPTAYAVAQGVREFFRDVDEYGARCNWWLRSSGNAQNEAVCMRPCGQLFSHPVNRDGIGVRPAILVD